MDDDRVSINVDDHEIREQRRAKKPHREAKSKFRAYRLLRAAAEEGNIDKFNEALKKCSAEEGVSSSDIMDIQGPSGDSLLHVAAGFEKDHILHALLGFIGDKQLATKVNNRGDTALHVAARAGRIPTAMLLLGCDCIMDRVNDMGDTALHEAVKNRHFELTRLLLNQQGSASVVRQVNQESKCPLYLAVETGDLKILEHLMRAVDGRVLGMSPVHGAVMHHKLEMLEVMSNQKEELFDLRDARGGTPLHLAAYVGYVEEVKFLVDRFAWSAFEGDNEGYLPIHVACKMGHLKIIKELLRHWPNTEELVNFNEGQNILHVAAKHGRATVVKYILSDPKLEKLINAKDKEGNTPLHVATFEGQPEVLLPLTQDKRVDLKLVNKGNLTALDIVDEQLKSVDPPLRKRMTLIVLESAGAPGSKDKAICRPEGLGPWRDLEPPHWDRLKDVANARMVVATVIATMTFAAGFSASGGYNNSEPDAGIATLLNKPMYDVFVICNTFVMYSSIIAVVMLLGAQIKDSHAMLNALRKAKLPLLIALATMSVAFMAGVYVTVSKRTWIAVVTLIFGITALFVILSVCITLYVPLRYSSHLVQLFADNIIRVGISISRSVTEGRAAMKSWQPQNPLISSVLVSKSKPVENEIHFVTLT